MGRFAGSAPVIVSKERRQPNGVDDPTKLRNATDLEGIFYTCLTTTSPEKN